MSARGRRPGATPSRPSSAPPIQAPRPPPGLTKLGVHLREQTKSTPPDPTPDSVGPDEDGKDAAGRASIGDSTIPVATDQTSSADKEVEELEDEGLRDLKTVVYCQDKDRSYATFSPRDLPRFDSKLGIRFDSLDVFDDTMILLRFNCPDAGCEVACPGGWKDLKRHVREAHGKQLCDICTRHKKVFTHEHALFTPAELRRHTADGDPPEPGAGGQSFTGHPECGFCHQRFMGNDELYEHCKLKHEECFLCRRKGQLHKYYLDYNALDQHFREDHYACRQPECLEAKFVVFDTEIDFRAHEADIHGLNRGKVKLDLNITYTSSRDGPRAYSEGRGDSRSTRGGGGRGNVHGGSASTVTAAPALSRPAGRDATPAETRAGLRVPEGFGTQLTEPDVIPGGRRGRGARGGRGGTVGGRVSSEANGGTVEQDGLLTPALATNGRSAGTTAVPDFPSLHNAISPNSNPPSAPPSAPDGLPARLLAIFDDDPSRYAQFRVLAQSYKAQEIQAADFLSRVVDLSLEACPPDDPKRRKARIVEVGKVWAKMAETAPVEEPTGKRTVPGMGAAPNKRDEMTRAWKDWKVKNDREEEEKRRLEAQIAFTNWSGATTSSSAFGGAGGKRVLVIKSTAARHKLPPTSRAGSSSTAAVLERISQEATQRRRAQEAERVKDAQTVWDDGAREDHTKIKMVSRDEADSMRAAMLADTPSNSGASPAGNWGSTTTKTVSDFPGLPKTTGVTLRAGRFGGASSSSISSSAGVEWGAVGTGTGQGLDPGDDSELMTGGKKKGKKKQVLMYVG
ncbi:hypothetical protein HDU93_004084 [Gonapodya sp. JEL0774]|nr:hypothetical protein HDU93_004084 [Gonapodya sp. JEL0774]